MLQAVKVRLRKPTRGFVFLARDITLARGDNVIVRSDRGLECGTCIVEPEDCPDEMSKRYTMSVVRKMTQHDENTYRQMAVDEAMAENLCRQKIRDRSLPMNLVDVEYTFDHHKVIFYFTAEDRVDFRELVRDLAHELKARIELRHIQVRDKAKLVGGFAACGRELCCATWLTGFMPISMRMAKRQSLSLNPSKISGQCGRLMCCLSYENEQYHDPKRRRVPLEAEEAEKPVGPEWEDLLEEEEEDAVAEGEVTGPGEPVLVVNPDGTEEVFEEEEEGGDAASPEKHDEPQRSRRRSRRRRRRKPHDANPPARDKET